MGAATAPRWGSAIVVALVAIALLAVRLDRPGFFDNEGRYAEVAREMLLRRDFVTPTMDFTLFLNKPPLLYWLTAVGFAALGLSEWVRLVPLLATALTLVATARLGARLWDETTGVVAAVLLALMVGFAQEARVLRPDMLLVLSVVAALACWLAAETATARRRTAWLVALYAVLGVGVLAKGLVPVIVAGVPIAVFTLRDHGRDGIVRLRPGLGVLVLAAVVLPWHVAVALRHPGFAWDYVVNQHVLFFLDKKFPRDSEGDPLLVFWGVFVARAFPWILLLPLSVQEARFGLATGASRAERASAFCWVWLLGVLGFFSLAPSRLEHYALPALPAVALLAARVVRRLALGLPGAVAWRWLAVVAALLVLVGGAGVVVGPGLLAQASWAAQAPDMVRIAALAAAAIAAGGAALAWAVSRRHVVVAVGALGVTAALIVVCVRMAEVAAEPLFTWKPLADRLNAVVPQDVEVVFEAPEEYQLVGGLAYYTRRRITLLEFPGFVPPTYLERDIRGMFLPRSEFLARWRAERPLVLVTDPQRERPTPDDAVPEPRHVLGRFGDRWLLANVPLGGAS